MLSFYYLNVLIINKRKYLQNILTTGPRLSVKRHLLEQWALGMAALLFAFVLLSLCVICVLWCRGLSVIVEGSLTLAMGKCLWFSVKIKVCQSSLSLP